jgi:hypothetical protein
MSALPPKADMVQHDRDVCFVTIAHIHRLIRSPLTGFLNRAHDRLAAMFLAIAIVSESHFIVGKSLEVEDGLA